MPSSPCRPGLTDRAAGPKREEFAGGARNPVRLVTGQRPPGLNDLDIGPVELFRYVGAHGSETQGSSFRSALDAQPLPAGDPAGRTHASPRPARWREGLSRHRADPAVSRQIAALPGVDTGGLAVREPADGRLRRRAPRRRAAGPPGADPAAGRVGARHPDLRRTGDRHWCLHRDRGRRPMPAVTCATAPPNGPGTLADWFTGRPAGGELHAVSSQHHLRLVARLTRRSGSGTITLASGTTVRFTIPRIATGPRAGVFDGIARWHDRGYRAGWIILPGGQQRGAAFYPSGPVRGLLIAISSYPTGPI